jgi:putative membrane protein
MGILVGWALNAGALLLLGWMIPAVHVDGFGTALIVALVLGLLNTFIRPVLIILTLPVNLLTLGLFTFVINGFLFWFAARILEGFAVRGFWWAVLAAIVYSLITSAIVTLLSGRRG